MRKLPLILPFGEMMKTREPLEINGGRYWDRTSDPYDVNVTLSLETAALCGFYRQKHPEHNKNTRLLLPCNCPDNKPANDNNPDTDTEHAWPDVGTDCDVALMAQRINSGNYEREK